MSVDKFGHYSSHHNLNESRLRKAIGFNLDRDRNINLHLKRIKNLGLPIEDNDAVTKQFVSESVNQLGLKLHKENTVLKNAIEEYIDTSVDSQAKSFKLKNESISKDIETLNKYIEERLKGIEDYIFKQILEPKYMTKLGNKYRKE